MTAAALSVVLSATACKKTDPKETRSERDAAALVAVKLPGYNLYDNQDVAAGIVRVTRDGKGVAAAVLTGADAALAPGLGCAPGETNLVFQTQGNAAVTGSDTIKSQVRKVSACQSLRAFVAEKQKSAGLANSPVLSALSDTLSRLSDFEIAILKFEGGLPTGDRVKWSPVKSYDEALTPKSPATEWKKWETLTGKFTALIGFNREETTSNGTFSRRVWLPTRIPSVQSNAGSLEFTTETWIVDSARSPIRDTQQWLKGPSQFMFPGFLFSGVSRFPNVTPDAEIQSPSPRLLAFVHKWTENTEAPESMRFAPQCLDAAPVLAILK